MFRQLFLILTVIPAVVARATVVQPHCVEGVAVRGVEPAPPLAPRFVHPIPGPRADDPPLIVRVFDPNGVLAGETQSPLLSVLSDSIGADRVQAVRRHLTERGRGVRVWLKHWSTFWDYVASDGPTLDIVFGGNRLTEAADVAVMGVIVQIYFEELKIRFASSWRDLVAEQVAALRANGFASWDESILRLEIEELFRLRTTWLLKYEYYVHATERPPTIDPFLERLRQFVRQTSTWSLEGAMRVDFRAFYDLDPILVDRLWQVPLPPCWEFALAAP